MAMLSEISTRAPKELDKKETKAETVKLQAELCDLQNVLYAENKHSILIILQGMDASGKDGAIKKVFSNVNPQGVSVRSYKAPTELELSHDFLWRIHQNAPAKGMIMIFNRSHYEDVLITRVHKWCDDKTAELRFGAINNFEELLTLHNNTLIFKFYLHISQEEQQERLKERLDDESKQWKYNEKDFEESKLWDQYMMMYEDVFENCNAVPWVIVLIGIIFFKAKIEKKKIIGVMIGFVGLLILTLSKKSTSIDSGLILILIATIFYGITVNLVGHYLKDIDGLKIATVSLAFMAIPAGIVMWHQNVFSIARYDTGATRSIVIAALLGIVGSAIASAFFYILIQKAGGLFASLVTYAIPIVAIFWAIVENENVTGLQIVSLGVILGGVYMANK